MTAIRTPKKKTSTGLKPGVTAPTVISFADYKKKRASANRASGKTTRYHYPKGFLLQSYFCRGGDGTWFDPRFTLSMLGDENFKSPIGALLDQLEAEGHNVQGARIEWLAFRDLAKQYSEMFFNLAIDGRESAVAAHLYSAPAKQTKP